MGLPSRHETIVLLAFLFSLQKGNSWETDRRTNERTNVRTIFDHEFVILLGLEEMGCHGKFFSGRTVRISVDLILVCLFFCLFPPKNVVILHGTELTAWCDTVLWLDEQTKLGTVGYTTRILGALQRKRCESAKAHDSTGTSGMA